MTKLTATEVRCSGAPDLLDAIAATPGPTESRTPLIVLIAREARAWSADLLSAVLTVPSIASLVMTNPALVGEVRGMFLDWLVDETRSLDPHARTSAHSVLCRLAKAGEFAPTHPLVESWTASVETGGPDAGLALERLLALHAMDTPTRLRLLTARRSDPADTVALLNEGGGATEWGVALAQSDLDAGLIALALSTTVVTESSALRQSLVTGAAPEAAWKVRVALLHSAPPAEFALLWRDLMRDHRRSALTGAGRYLPHATPEQLAALTPDDLAPCLTHSSVAIRFAALAAAAGVGSGPPRARGRTR